MGSDLIMSYFCAIYLQSVAEGLALETGSEGPMRCGEWLESYADAILHDWIHHEFHEITPWFYDKVFNLIKNRPETLLEFD